MRKSRVIRPVIRLSDFKEYPDISYAWNDNFIGKVIASKENTDAFRKAVRESEEFNGYIFEYKDFYNGVKNDGIVAAETL